MKKLAMSLVMMVFVFTMSFAGNFTVEDFKGTVKKEVRTGEWVDVKKGETLSDATMLDIKFNSELIVKDSNGTVTIRKMSKGTLSSLVASVNTAGGVKIAGKAVETNVVAAKKITNVSTASTRASSAAADVQWVED